jgi:predicted metal-dependent phosphoesterase TrpH
VLALTDHDELAGIAEARATAAQTTLTLIPATEISVSWEDLTIHVVALRVDPDNETLQNGLAAVRSGRDARARRIAAALETAGIPGAFEGALKYVTSERLISRSHFARFLVERGICRDVKDVFKRYLTPGKPGYVRHAWADMADALEWIRVAGGQAVVAHPGRYPLTGTGVRRLLGEFRDRGGAGIEVLSSSHTDAQVAEFGTLARAFGLRASCGSDYHGPGESRLDLGDLPPLPAGLTPIWSGW